MSRENKFRAFIDGEMIYSHNNSINHGHIQLSWFFDKIKFRPDIEPMQFTGLKDKNGVDIYEGDILKNDGYNDWRCGENGAVRYEAEIGGFIVEGSYNKNQHHETLTCDLVCECRVIGNIH